MISNETLQRFQARFGWFWYNDEEIWRDSQAELDEKMRRFAQQGLTHAITFSSTHFRWSFRPYWPQINDCLRKIIIAAHKVRVKVIEHHSAILKHFPDTPERLADFQHTLQLRKSSLTAWPGLLDYLVRPANEETAWCQINGATGEPVTPYAAHANCCNNPDFQREYLQYLSTVYACGVDGIMTDDVQFFGLGQACACPVCRKLFQEKFAYELPESGESWQNWHGNMRDPVFLAWLKFRFESVLSFHQLVHEHYTRLGLNLLRPNYSSSILNSNMTALALEKLPALDWVFQECCFSSVIRYSWPEFLHEQMQRALCGRTREIPHKMMFYADTPDHLLFSWGLSRLAGALFSNTPEGGNATEEHSLRAFEQEFEENFTASCPAPSVGFLDSYDNRCLAASYNASRLKFWMQSCWLRNIPIILLDIRYPETWAVPVLVVNELFVLSDEDVANLKQYAAAGACLVVSGLSGAQKEDGSLRSDGELSCLWPCSEPDNPDNWTVQAYGKGRICRTGFSFGYPGSLEDKRRLFVDYALRFRYDSLIDLAKIKKEFTSLWVDRKHRDIPANGLLPWQKYHDGVSARAEVFTLLEGLCGDALTLRTANFPELVLAVPYINHNGSGMSIQILNAAGTLEKKSGDLGNHQDPIPFPEWKGDDGWLETILPHTLPKVQTVEWISLNRRQNLQWQQKNDKISIIIPAGLLRDYVMIRIA